MGSEHDVERLFSENVDHLLAGDEVKIDPGADHSLRTELDFAGKMIKTRPELSSDFKANLKVKLLLKLAEQEPETRVKEKPGWFRRLIPRQPVWQFATAMLIIMIVGGIWWGTGIFRKSMTPSAPSTTGMILKVDADTDKTAYRPGEEVKIEVTLKNVTSEPFKIEQFPPILSLMRADSRQPVYTFTAGKEVRTLAPDETADFELSWNQRDDRGRYVPSGGYYLELEDLDSQGRSIQLNLTRPVRFDILPATSGGGRIRRITNRTGIVPS